MKSRILRRLWRLTRRLTRSQGSAPDDTAPASMYKAGRAGSPKQLARNAKNPGETRVFERRGRDSNPRYPCGYTGFRDRHIRPLCHLSGFTSSVIQHTRPVAGRSAFVETLAIGNTGHRDTNDVQRSVKKTASVRQNCNRIANSFQSAPRTVRFTIVLFKSMGKLPYLSCCVSVSSEDRRRGF